jgi:hypothetical protein
MVKEWRGRLNGAVGTGAIAEEQRGARWSEADATAGMFDEAEGQA